MNELVGAVRHGLRNLASFSGRDPRQQFWFYALFVYALGTVAGMVTMVPLMASAFARMQRFAAEHPELTEVRSGPGHYSIRVKGDHPELMPDMSLFFIVVAAVSVVSVLLLAAAVTRRLHDRGMTGWWGLLPLPFLGTGLILFPRMFSSAMLGAEPDMQMFGLLFVNNLVYLGLLGLLIWALCGKSDPGSNRYGPAPESIEASKP